MSKYRKIFWWLVIGGVTARLLYWNAGIVELAADEAYYWQWSRRLDWCYYSKGPLIAYLIRSGTVLLGNTELGIRFPTLLISLFTLYISYLLYQKLYPNQERGLAIMALLYHSIPLLLLGSLVMTIDPPFCALWLLGLLALHFAVRESKAWGWVLISLSVGLGILTKYTMLLFIPGLFLYLAASQQNRIWLKRPAPYLAVLAAFLFFLPPLIWNAQHQWVSFHHTADLGGFGKETHGLSNLVNFPLMIATQAGVISPILFGLMAFAVYRHSIRAFGSEKNDDSLLLLSGVLPVIALYTLVSLKRPINANWLAAIYPPTVILTAQYWNERLAKPPVRRWLEAGAAVGILTSFVMIFSDTVHILGLPNSQKLDPAARMKGWSVMADLAQRTGLAMPQNKSFFYIGDRYQMASALAFYIPDHPNVFCASPRPLTNQYDIWGGSKYLIGQNAVFVQQAKTEADLSIPLYIVQSFERVECGLIEPYLRLGIPLHWHQTWRCFGFKGWSINTELESLSINSPIAR